MTTVKQMVMAGLAMIVATPVVAQTAPVAEKPKKERTICRSEEKTGSRLGGGSKVCHTQAEWKALEASDTYSRKATGASDLFRRAGSDH